METIYAHTWTDGRTVHSALADHFGEPGEQDATLACASDCAAAPLGGVTVVDVEDVPDRPLNDSESKIPLGIQRRDVPDDPEPTDA